MAARGISLTFVRAYTVFEKQKQKSTSLISVADCAKRLMINYDDSARSGVNENEYKGRRSTKSRLEKNTASKRTWLFV